MTGGRRRLWPALLLLGATVLFATGISIEKAEEGEHGSGHEETILGIEPESTPLVMLAVVASLLLVVALWRRPGSPAVMWVAVVFCAGFAVMDVLEVAHKLEEDESTIAVIAALVAALHAAAAASALALLRRARPVEVG